MKKILFITTLFILSCGKPNPSACDCAKLEKEHMESKWETLSKTAEEQSEIEAGWGEKLEPCKQIIKEDDEFEKKKQECLMMLIQAENEKETEESQ